MYIQCGYIFLQPFLIDGFKFDLRIYTLVTSCDPLRIFVFKDGLSRFATLKYTDPSHNNVVSSSSIYQLIIISSLQPFICFRRNCTVICLTASNFAPPPSPHNADYAQTDLPCITTELWEIPVVNFHRWMAQ